MKISTLTAALVIASACTTGVAHAVSVNPHGLGQVLLYPYYTVNKGQDTLLSVVNSSDVGKAVKVRFLEGYNGRTVLDFTLFLSAHDIWSAAVSQVDSSSGAKITTTDHSCTFPQIVDAGPPFSAANYSGAPGSTDSGPQTIARTREGHIEIIADGDIVAGSATDQRITHVQDGSPGGGSPAGCDAITANGFGADLVTPTTGLRGSASIVNVGEGTFFAYAADALSGFTSVAFTDTVADVDHDSLARANTDGSAFTGGAVATVPTDSGEVLTLDYPRGIDAVSAVLMADSISNDYLVSAGLGANTDWIVTFPTKRFYVDPALVGNTAGAPFVETFNGGHSSVSLGLDIYDQEGFHQSNRPPAEGCGILCPALVPFMLPYEVNAIRFVPDTGTFAPSGVFGSQLSTVFGPLFGNASDGDAGWARIGFNDALEPHALTGGMNWPTPVALNGLPSIGFMVYNIVNTNAAPGRLANYGATFAHRSTMSCTPCENSPSGGAAAE
ncbi:MAG: hypothetical protein ABIV12_03015 [Dokdonella sp.]|uniref:hypothetical protein n=1 Tax=Dokdonella sp. TaxID=2291710 RepID=UPI0032642A5B